jgi:hypothetical protein
MISLRLLMTALALLAPLAAGAGASTVDAFDRPDGTDVGGGWVEQAGDWSIDRGQLVSGAGPSRLLRRGVSARGLSQSIDLLAPEPGKVSYVALLSLYDSPSAHLAVKIQSNSPDGRYDALALSVGDRPGWQGMTGGGPVVLLSAFASGTMTTRIVGDVVSVELDTDRDGQPDWTLQRGGLPLELLGDGAGVGGFGAARMDNYVLDAPAGGEIPEPTTALSLAGALAAGGAYSARRRRY